MTKKYIALIYEGEKTEKQLVANLNRIFFTDVSELVPIMFPAGENIYMLWQQLKEDEFQTDLIEILREYNEEARRTLESFERKDFMEIYLFFDYDGHQKNLQSRNADKDVIKEMLETFSEETEFGKLYINYPMVESLRDNLPVNMEYCFRRCVVDFSEIGKYKRTVHEISYYQDFRKLTREDWSSLCMNALRKLNCIIRGTYEMPSRRYFKNEMSQKRLYEMQKEKYISGGKIAVINSCPLFILEYFKEDVWKSLIKCELPK